MTRLGIALLLIPLALLGAWGVRNALRTDEERIVRQFRSMAAGFDDGDVGDCIRPLAGDFEAEPWGAGRDDLRRGLIGFFLRDRAGGERAHRVELGEPTVEEIYGVEPREAEVSCEATFLRRSSGDAPVPVWRIVIDAHLEDDGGGWRIDAAEVRTIEGRPPR